MRSENSTLKERFDKAFYGLLDAGNKLQELSYKVEYAGNLIKLNKIRQCEVKSLLQEQTNEK